MDPTRSSANCWWNLVGSIKPWPYGWVAPAASTHPVWSLVSQVLGKLLVEPGGVHQTLAIRIQPLVALVKTWIHLWPIQVLGHVRGSCNDRRALVRPVSVLLHVLRKIRLLSVTLSTVGADVCLYMFRLLVLRDVLKERLFVGEALVAGVALVRLVSLVAARVGLQVRQLGEGLRATWYPALVRLVPRVRPDVLLKVGELGELALADLATVRLDPEVDPRVLQQVGAVGEGLSACSTFVGFWLSQVNLSVELEVGLAVESLWAHLALVLPLTVEAKHVVRQPARVYRLWHCQV